jgi:hypothetical protein
MKQDETDRYPLLREYLTLKEMALKPAFTLHDVAQMFDVTTRSIQSWVETGKLNTRDVPGRGKVFPVDLETLLSRSRQAAVDEPRSASPTTGSMPVPQRTTSAPFNRTFTKAAIQGDRRG